MLDDNDARASRTSLIANQFPLTFYFCKNLRSHQDTRHVAIPFLGCLKVSLTSDIEGT